MGRQSDKRIPQTKTTRRHQLRLEALEVRNAPMSLFDSLIGLSPFGLMGAQTLPVINHLSSADAQIDLYRRDWVGAGITVQPSDFRWEVSAPEALPAEESPTQLTNSAFAAVSQSVATASAPEQDLFGGAARSEQASNRVLHPPTIPPPVSTGLGVGEVPNPGIPDQAKPAASIAGRGPWGAERGANGPAGVSDPGPTNQAGFSQPQGEGGLNSEIQASGTIAGHSAVATGLPAHGETLAQPPQLTPEQGAQREAATIPRPIPGGLIDNGTPEVPSNAAPTEAKTSPDQGSTTPGNNFTFYRNSPLPSPPPPLASSSIGEPNPGSIGRASFQTGNWYASVSGNYGTDFRFINPYTTFPATGDFSGGFCCDQRVATDRRNDGDPARGFGMVMWYLQYLQTGGTVNDVGGARIAVANSAAKLLDNTWWYYGFTPETFHQGRNWWMDYPNMQVSNNYLFASSNMYQIVGSGFQHVVWRMPLSELYANVGTLDFTYWIVTSGNSLAFTNNAGSIMYAASYPAATSLRIFTQNESGTNLNFVDRTVGRTWGTRPDMGSVAHIEFTTGGVNWVGRSDERVQSGWLAGTDVGFMWNSAKDPHAQLGNYASHPFVRVAIFNSSTLSLVSQPDIWNGSYAWHYGAMATNDRNEIAGPVFAGGAAFAPLVNILIRDSVDGYWGTYFAVGGTSASNLWGDYVGSAKHQRYGNTWVGTSYVQNGTTVTPYFFWFGRQALNPNRLSGLPHLGNSIGTALDTGIDPAGGNFTQPAAAIWDPTYGRLNVHIYRFTANAGTAVDLLTSQPANGDIVDTVLRLFDAAGAELAIDDDGGVPPYSHISSYILPDTGTYYVGVSGQSNVSYNPNIAGSGTIGPGAFWPTYGDYRLDLNLAPATTRSIEITTTAADPDVAGTLFDITVTALDAGGTQDSSYRGTVDITTSDGGASGFPINYHFLASDKGTHTFKNVGLVTAGPQNITALDSSLGAGASADVHVVAAAADHFQVNAPTDVSAGDFFDTTVTARDPYGNVDTNYSETVSWSVTDFDPSETLPADYQFVPGPGGDNGVHTYLGETSLNITGTRTLSAFDQKGILGTADVNVNGTGPHGGAGSRSGRVDRIVMPSAVASSLVDRSLLTALVEGNLNDGPAVTRTPVANFRTTQLALTPRAAGLQATLDTLFSRQARKDVSGLVRLAGAIGVELQEDWLLNWYRVLS